MKVLFFSLLVCCLSFAEEPANVAMAIPATAQISQDGSTLLIAVGPLQIGTASAFPVIVHADATIPVDGWIIGSEKMIERWPTDVRTEGTISAQIVNLERQDLLCKRMGERFARIGEGQPAWPTLKDFGYHVHKGDRIQVQLEVRMRGAESIALELGFQPADSGGFRRDAYPMWFNSRGCGPADFDLKPGRNISSGSFEIPLNGTLVALQGGLRKNAEYIDVANRSRDLTFAHQTWDGQPLPLVTPMPGTEFRVDQGDFVAIAAGYNNPSEKEKKKAGIGLALGLFVPVDDAKMSNWAKQAHPAGN